MVFFHSSITNNDIIHVLCCTIVVSLRSQPLQFIVHSSLSPLIPSIFALSFMSQNHPSRVLNFIVSFTYHTTVSFSMHSIKDASLKSSWPNRASLSPQLVGNDFTNRQREIEYPTRSETDQSHHVPVAPTETPNSGTGENGVLIMEKDDSRPTSFFAQPGILAGKLNETKLRKQNAQTFSSFSCGWRSRCWFIVRDLSSDVHRVSNAKEGRGLVCIRRAKAITASKLLHQEP